MYILAGFSALLVEFIITCITRDSIMVGIMIITLGFLFLFCALRGYAKIKGAVIVMTVYCLLWGVGMTCCSLIEKITGDFRNYDMILFSAGLGCAFAGMGIYMGIIKKLQCSRRISARYDGAQAYRVKLHTAYTPLFSFTYEGKHYSNTTGEGFSAGKLNKRFQKGKSYPIYINPKNPNSLCVSRIITFEWILLILLGVLFLYTTYQIIIS